MRTPLVVGWLAVASMPARGQPVEADGEIIVVVDTRSAEAVVRDHRAVSVVDAEDIERREPATAPDALRYAPGVSVQQTNSAGGSPFVRGSTGQQTLLMIDGFRLNTSIMRSGPNQYFNTLDVWTVERIEVLRGAGSVLYGSDAIGGVLHVTTRDPATHGHRATARARTASAERALGGRVEVEGAAGPIAWIGGVSGRSFGDLRSPGPPALAEVPAYDGERQLFTAYDEASGDAKAVAKLGPGRLTTAVRVFRQYDAPRTDKCAPGPPLACRYFDEQFYDMAYARYGADFGPVRELDVGFAVARTHERRSDHREADDLVRRELDEVITLGLTGRASAPTWRFGEAGALRVSYGGDAFVDFLSSEASTEVISTGASAPQARGKYLDGSRYASLAAFGFGEIALDGTTSVTAGARANAVRAEVAADPAAGAPGFTDWLVNPVASAGVRVRLAGPLYAVAGADQGFRAPNLDDLTAQSSEGPGFQVPNPDLGPETSLTLEGGLQVRHPRLWATGFAYTTFIDDFIARRAAACPPDLPPAQMDACSEAGAVFELVNAESAQLRGVELAAKVWLDAGVSVLATATWTKGDKQVSEEPAEPREPISKMPPVHGVVAVRFDIVDDYFVETGARWALAQDRLSPADVADARVPPGGTPAYGVVDVRAGAWIRDYLRATLAIENLTDTRYRVHGSGVDGTGFNVVVGVSGTVGTP